jgi:hypothetical protein
MTDAVEQHYKGRLPRNTMSIVLCSYSLLRLFRRRDHAHLLHHAQFIKVIPAFHHLALIREPEDAYPRYRYLIAGGSDAPELALMGAASSPAGYYLVSLGYLILDIATQVGEGLAKLADEPLNVFGPTLFCTPVCLMRDISVKDLVC